MGKSGFTEEQRIKRKNIEICNKKTSENIIKIDFVKYLLEISNKNIGNEDLRLWLSLFCIHCFRELFYKDEDISKHLKYYSEIILQIFNISKIYFCLLYVYINKPELIKKRILKHNFKEKSDFLRLFKKK